ncbi:MAG: hypothetical protein ACRDS1_11625, partial [Pseudonocardiaceae bacterium]
MIVAAMIEDHRPRLPGTLRPARAADWQQLIRDQHGLLDTDQLRLLDIGPGVVAANVEAQRWRRVLPRVYATFTGPLIREARITGALLYGGPRAVLSHMTAAEEWRMLVSDPLTPVHITVPYGCSAVSQPPLVVVHRSRAFPYLVVAIDPPRTSKADTVLDLATSEPDARAGMRRFVALATRGRVPVRELQRRLAERRPRRYGKALADALRLLAEGVQSALEQRYACDVESAHALPTAQRQQPIVVDSRTLWEDVSYDTIGIPLTVRLDGRAFHDAPEVAFRDRRRDNAAELADRHRLVYGWNEVTGDPCGVAQEVATVLRRSGWHGPLRQCGDSCA